MIPLDARQRDLLQEAATWRLISLLLECPSKSWQAQVNALAAQVSDEDLVAAVDAANAEAGVELYHSTFGPGGPASPREVSYHNSVQLGYLLSELNAYYDSFAYQPGSAEVADHVAVEAGFLGYLRLKQAYALACSDPERAAIAEEGARQFLAEHLRNIAQPLAASLVHSGIRYLEMTGQALLRLAGPPVKTVLPPAELKRSMGTK